MTKVLEALSRHRCPQGMTQNGLFVCMSNSDRKGTLGSRTPGSICEDAHVSLEIKWVGDNFIYENSSRVVGGIRKNILIKCLGLRFHAQGSWLANKRCFLNCLQSPALCLFAIHFSFLPPWGTPDFFESENFPHLTLQRNTPFLPLKGHLDWSKLELARQGPWAKFRQSPLAKAKNDFCILFVLLVSKLGPILRDRMDFSIPDFPLLQALRRATVI